MSIEQALSDSGKVGTFKEIASKPKDILYSKLLDAAVEMIDFQDPNGYIDKYYFKRQNRVKVVYFRHLSHADAGALILTAKRLNKVGNFPINFVLPLAASLETGDQSDKLTDFYNVIKPKLQKHRIEPIHVAREKDREEYRLARSTAENLRLFREVKRGAALMYFPEGTVEGGRRNPNTGEINGLSQVKDEFMPQMLSRIGADQEIAFLPISVSGTNRIYDPTTANVTSEAGRIVPMQWLFRQFPKLATATVGEPFTSQDMLRSGVNLNNPQEFNNYLMYRQAEMVPSEERGFYK
jgi:hypothetical protein